MNHSDDPLRRVSTGLPALDKVLDHLRIGDNVVWAVDDLSEYRAFVEPYVRQARSEGRRLHYMRFADHAPLVRSEDCTQVHRLDANEGFEAFTAGAYRTIQRAGAGAFYVFDSLSDLLSAWATDRMIGNFFQVICPYLFRLDTVAYFGLIRGRHSFDTIAHIRGITQLLIDVHTRGQRRFVHPLKVWKRQSPTMFLPHELADGRLLPVTQSHQATVLSAELAKPGLSSAQRRMDYWDRLFLTAEQVWEAQVHEPSADELVEQIANVMITRDHRMRRLVKDHLRLRDLLDVKARLIGTGFIGGKAVGMLLARQVLLSQNPRQWRDRLEPHDSFYIGSDVYYWYLVHNGWWDLLMEHKTPEGYFPAAARLHDLMLRGEFPWELSQELQRLLEYFGQYPIVIRSSSLLEDGYDSAFAGKYESVFCVNQGSPEERLRQVEEAIRVIFASTMSPSALAYRRQRGLEQREEPMALLVQRVSGAYRGSFYFPDIAGVGVSYNTFVWNRDMDPRAGMLRLVVGLGTRAVDRVEDDYACLVALDHPLRRPLKDTKDARRYSQRAVDLLNITDNALQTHRLENLVKQGVDLPLEWCASAERDEPLSDSPARWTINMERLLTATDFVPVMQEMLRTLQQAYGHPVEIEFAGMLQKDGRALINLLQCRPMQVKGRPEAASIPSELPEDSVVFRTRGGFMGGSIAQRIDRVILIDPAKYAALPTTDKYEVARLIGRLNRALPDRSPGTTMLIGPGRWGTSTPQLGVPVRFGEINHIGVLVEVAEMGSGMIPDLSFGTHFFHDLVETGIFYVALMPDQRECTYQVSMLENLPDIKASLLDGQSTPVADVVRVIDTREWGLRLAADVVSQELVAYRDPAA